MPEREERQDLERKILVILEQLRVEFSHNMDIHLQRRLPPEDVIQETYVRALQGLESFHYRDDAALAAWLRTIASNVIRSAIRKRCAAPNEEIAEALIESGVLRPSQVVARTETLAALNDMLKQLDSRHRRVLQMRYVDNLSFAEIGAAFFQPDNIVRGWHRNALQQLAELLGSATRYLP